MPNFSQFGLGMPTQNPFSGMGIGAPTSNMFSGMGLSPMGGGGGGFFSGLHGPQLGSGLGGMMQIASIPGVLNDLFSYRDPDQGWLGAGLQGAAQGAGAGSMFGAPGAALGAGAGYLSGKK